MDAILRQMTFELGYIHGRDTKLLVSNREVLERFPFMTAEAVELYQNGRDDGIAGDTLRLGLGRAAMTATTT